MARKNPGIVYSTDHGRMCPECAQPVEQCRCGPGAAGRASGSASGNSAKRKVRVQRSTKGRRGKTVSVVSGLDLNAFELANLARALKQRCGTGGTVKDGQIEIQGDHVATLVDFLRKQGHDAA